MVVLVCMQLTDPTHLSAAANLTARAQGMMGDQNKSKLSSFSGSGESQSLLTSSEILNYSACANSRGPSRSCCQQFLGRRVPKGKGVVVVFVLNALEGFIFFGGVYGLISAVFRGTSESQMKITQSIAYSAGRIFYPITGYLADVYFGRHRLMKVGLWLLWLAFCLYAMAASFCRLLHLEEISTNNYMGYVGLVLFCAGSGGFETNIIPFGVDQQQGSSSDELSSYFHWWYWTRQLGNFSGVLIFLLLKGINWDTVMPGWSDCPYDLLQALLGLIVISVALVIDNCCHGWFFENAQLQDSFKQIYKVTCFSVTVKRRQPRRRRAFRYGEGRVARMDLAKVEFDGIYTSEEVEDVKTFYRVLMIIFSLMFYCFVYEGVVEMVTFHVSHFLSNTTSSPYLVEKIYPQMLNIFNPFLLLLLIPLKNVLVTYYSFSPRFIRVQIGIGLLLMLLCTLSLVYLEIVEVVGGHYALESSQRVLWLLLLPGVLYTVSEMFVFISALEFIYAQSPENMKGLMTGLFYLIFGVFSGLSSALFYSREQWRDGDYHHINDVLWYHVILASVALVGFVVYIISACLYSNRRRPHSGEEMEYLRQLYTRAFQQ